MLWEELTLGLLEQDFTWKFWHRNAVIQNSQYLLFGSMHHLVFLLNFNPLLVSVSRAGYQCNKGKKTTKAQKSMLCGLSWWKGTFYASHNDKCAWNQVAILYSTVPWLGIEPWPQRWEHRILYSTCTFWHACSALMIADCRFLLQNGGCLKSKITQMLSFVSGFNWAFCAIFYSSDGKCLRCRLCVNKAQSN